MNVQSMKRKITTLTLAVALFAMPALASYGQTAGGNQSERSDADVATMPKFTVTEERADPRVTKNSLSLSRVQSSLLDTPVSINVISRDFLNDIDAGTIFDATRYTSGISQYLSGVEGIHLDVDNLFNKRFIWEVTARSTAVPYAGTNVRLATTVSF